MNPEPQPSGAQLGSGVGLTDAARAWVEAAEGLRDEDRALLTRGVEAIEMAERWAQINDQGRLTTLGPTALALREAGRSGVGAFGVLAALVTPDRQHDDVRDFAGMSKERPGLAALLTLFLLSLGGFPPTVGFIGKWYIFNAAIQEGLYTLAILGVLTSVVSVFFYLRIVVMMFMSSNKAELEVPHFGIVGTLGLALAALATFYLGILPTRLIDLATQSISTIF